MKINIFLIYDILRFTENKNIYFQIINKKIKKKTCLFWKIFDIYISKIKKNNIRINNINIISFYLFISYFCVYLSREHEK